MTEGSKPRSTDIHVMVPVEETARSGEVRAIGPQGQQVEPRLLADLLEDCLQAVAQTRAKSPKVSIELRGQMKTTESGALKWILELGSSDEETNTIVLRVDAEG